MYFFYFIALALLGAGFTPAFATEDDDVAEAVAHCERNGLTFLLADFTSHPADSDRFAVLFSGVNDRLARALENRMHLGGDTAEEIASLVLTQIWNREIVWDGESTWTNAHTFNWLLRVATFKAMQARDKQSGHSVETVNVSDETPDGDNIDFFGQADSTGLVGRTLSQGDIDRLPDAVQRFVLMRLHQGRSPREVAEELGRSESTVSRLTQAARASLEEILKGRPPIVPAESHRDENLAVRVQDILEEELEPRPIRVQPGDLLLTEALFRQLLVNFGEQNRNIAVKYFVEGKRFAQIQAETGLRTRVIAGAIESASDRIGKHFGEPIQPSPRSIWIVDEQNLPVVPRRQMDFALPPRNPIDVDGAKFWAAIKDLPLRHQEIAKMRFIDGLSSAYISFITGMNPGSVTHVLTNISQRVSVETGKEVSVASLVLAGDTSMIHVSAVEIPARAYLELLELRNNPSEATKLAVARMISGLPVENLPRIVLTDPIYEHLLYDDNQEHFMPLPQDPESFVSVGTLELVRRRLSDVDGRVLKLYLQHRWSVSTLSFYFKLDAAETRKALERGGTALERELGTTLQLARVLVVDSEVDARTIQVDGAEFRDRFRRMPTTSLASVKVMLRDWQGVELTPEKRVELLGPDGRRLFESREEFRAPVPAKPTYFLRADFENALLQSNLSDQEKQILRLRFFDGWGAAGITYLLELPPDVARRAIEKGVIHLNMRTREKIYAPNLRVVPRCAPDIHLRTHAVSAAQYEAIMARVMSEKDYRPEAVGKIVEEITEIPGITVDDVTLINERNEPPTPGGESFRRPRPKEPIVITHQQMWDAMNTDDQRNLALLRFEYGWSRPFIMRVTGKTENQFASGLERIVGNLKRKVSAEASGGRIVVVP